MELFFKRKYRLTRHLLFWLGVWLFFVYFFSYNFDNTPYVLAFSTVLLPITAVSTYLVAYYLIPKFLFTKKLLWFGIYIVFTLLFTTFCTLLAIILSVGYIPGLHMDDLPPMSRNYVFILILVYLIVALVSIVSLWKHSLETATHNSKLQQKILETQFRLKIQELDYLKRQIHPHFLFNTLNTIYGFALRRSKETSDIILKLSNLLDYILYQVKKPRVSLQDEVKHIQQYIDLEKIRFQDTLKVSFITEVENEQLQVAPMLLLPFVENAFKHGFLINDFLTVRILISASDHSLHFHIKNTCNIKASKSGIGLENIKKRLELLYPESHILQLKPEENSFTVDLSLSLTETLSYGDD